MELNNERAPDDPDAQGLVVINGKTGVHGRDYIIIDRRVDQIENAIAVVADRIEEVMAKLEEVEQHKIQESEFGNELDMDTQMNDFNNGLREMQHDKNKTE
uniref:Uncharacterized protein n=1 Tax=Acrobeloides nanus TaxID=290746 RepID=A0A914CDL2_9BILA